MTNTPTDQDELFDLAKRIVLGHKKITIDTLQQELEVGYARVVRIVDDLETAGVVIRMEDGELAVLN